MTQTPDELQNLAAPTQTRTPETTLADPIVPESYPIPAPTYVFTPNNSESTNSGASASPPVKKAIIAGVLSGLLAGALGFTAASVVGNTPSPSISLPAASGEERSNYC